MKQRMSIITRIAVTFSGLVLLLLGSIRWQLNAMSLQPQIRAAGTAGVISRMEETIGKFTV